MYVHTSRRGVDVHTNYIAFCTICISVGKSMYNYSYVDVRAEICLVSSTLMTAIEIHNLLLRGKSYMTAPSHDWSFLDEISSCFLEELVYFGLVKQKGIKKWTRFLLQEVCARFISFIRGNWYNWSFFTQNPSPLFRHWHVIVLLQFQQQARAGINT